MVKLVGATIAYAQPGEIAFGCTLTPSDDTTFATSVALVDESPWPVQAQGTILPGGSCVIGADGVAVAGGPAGAVGEAIARAASGLPFLMVPQSQTSAGGGSTLPAVVNTAVSFSVDGTKPGAIYNATAASSAIITTLPVLTAGDAGFSATVVKADSSAGIVVVPGVGARLFLQGQSVMVLWTGTAWRIASGYLPCCAFANSFGTFSDGDVAIMGAVSLTRDMQYRQLAVTVGAALNTQGWMIYAETVDMRGAPAGAISRNGGSGNTASGSTGAGAGSTTTGKTTPGSYGNVSGANGGTAVGAQPTNIGANTSGAYAAGTSTGGVGGVGASGGGTARAGSGGTPIFTYRGTAIPVSNYSSAGATSVVSSSGGGQGGNAGGGDGVNSGGGGGASGKGGGCIVINCARFITDGTTAAASIQAKGGAGGGGGVPPAGNCGGGGGAGGGSGGLIAVAWWERVGAAVVDIADVSGGNGGNGGNGVGTGTAGNGAYSGNSGAITTQDLQAQTATDHQVGGQTNQVANVGQTGGIPAVATATF
jgi:hypothetical protein